MKKITIQKTNNNKNTAAKKITRKTLKINIKRVLALILALSLLPWSDYAVVTAYAMEIQKETQQEEESTERTTDDMVYNETEGISEAETEDTKEGTTESTTEKTTETTAEAETQETSQETTEGMTEASTPAKPTEEASESITEAETGPYKKPFLKNADRLEITEDTQLEKDITAEALVITSGILRLNGHTITVKKSVSIEGGTLFIDKGELITGENLHISGTTDNTALRMADKDDRITIQGDFIYEGQQKADVTAGTLTLCGDIIYTGNAGEKFTGNHITIFVGKGEQRAQGTESFELNNVIFKNSEVTGLDAFVIKGCVDDCNQTIQGRINAGNGISYAGGVYHGDVIYKESTYDQKEAVCIEGNVIFERVDTYNCENTYLDINGDFEWGIEAEHTAESNPIRVAGNVLLKKYGSDEKDYSCKFKTNIILDGNRLQIAECNCYYKNKIKTENKSDDGVWFKSGFWKNNIESGKENIIGKCRIRSLRMKQKKCVTAWMKYYKT